MFTRDQYELLDIGQGRRLERFGAFILDRPAPAAVNMSIGNRTLWSSVDAHFKRQSASQGVWSFYRDMPAVWPLQHGPFQLEMRCAPSGAVGVFPEQAENWDWIARQIQTADRPLKVLNLFAYTGGSTLAAAAAGAEVVHVDAARSVVEWARQNARNSGLESAPVRWIIDDARKFVAREVRRGAKYDGLILDPPSYGHGPKAQAWKFEEHLPELLEALRQLVIDTCEFVLLTCHTPGWEPRDLGSLLAEQLLGTRKTSPDSCMVHLTSQTEQRLVSGLVTRWSAKLQ